MLIDILAERRTSSMDLRVRRYKFPFTCYLAVKATSPRQTLLQAACHPTKQTLQQFLLASHLSLLTNCTHRRRAAR